jgi:hypothetical protein
MNEPPFISQKLLLFYKLPGSYSSIVVHNYHINTFG